MSDWVTTLGLGLAISGAIPSLIQLARCVWKRSAAGWDPVLAWAWLSSYISWSVFCFWSGVIPAAVSGLVGAAAMITVLVFLKLEGLWSWRTAFGWFAWMVLIVSAGLFWWEPALPIATLLVDIVVLVPQTRRLMRAKDVTGMSRTYWASFVVLGVLWIWYSWLIGEPLIALYQYVGIPWSAWAWLRVSRVRKIQRNQSRSR